MKILSATILLLWSVATFAQESNNGKKLWGISVLNQEAPKFVIEKWISEQPEMKGKFVLIDFWATWCGPCRVYIPTLNALHEKYKDQLVIVGLSNESAEKVMAFENPKIQYFEAIDTRGRMKDKLQITGIPHAILIDPNGIVRWEGFPLLQNFQLTEKVVVDLMKKYKPVETSATGKK